jgi:hypothetical protein
LSTPRFKPDNDAGDPALMPLDGSGSQQPGAAPSDTPSAATESLLGLELDPGTSGRRISANTLLLAGVIVVAGGVLAGMRKVGLGPATATAAANFDASLADSAATPRRDHRPVLADLNATRTQLQVPDDQVRGNPFLFAALGGDATDPAAAERAAAEALKVEAERLRKLASVREQQLAQSLTNLRLNSVVGGSRPRARINGQLVGVGERVGEFFIVKAIHGRAVDLDAEGKLFTLQMEQRATPTEEPSLDPTRQENPPPVSPWAPPPMNPNNSGGW